MNAEKKELLCGKCRKRVSYHIFKRHAKTIIKDIEIEYENSNSQANELFVLDSTAPTVDVKNFAKKRI